MQTSCFKLLAVIVGMVLLALPSHAQFTFSHIGGGATGSLTDNGNGSYTLEGGGNDIWSGSDAFDFAHYTQTGDFDVRVRVDSIEPTARWTKAGLMVRETLADNSRMVFNRVTPGDVPTGNGGNGANDSRLGYRTGTSAANLGEHEDGTGSPEYPNAWLRIQRQGTTFIGYASNDGLNWRVQNSLDTTTWEGGALPAAIELGLAVSRHSSATTPEDLLAVAQFRAYANVMADPVMITRQPADATVLFGQYATFNLEVAGGLDGLTYQWKRDGADIPGATGPTYTFGPVSDPDEGATFSVAVVNPRNGTSATSASATLHLTLIYDFNDNALPGGMALAGSNARIEDGAVKLTLAENSAWGVLTLPDINAGKPVEQFFASFDYNLWGSQCCGDPVGSLPADGMSLNLVVNPPTPAYGVPAEEGFSPAAPFTVAFDTWDNGGGEAPAIDLIIRGQKVATYPIQPSGSPTGATADSFKHVEMSMKADGTFNMTVDGNPIFTDVASGYLPVNGGKWVFGARTGGANDNHWLDNISINVFQNLGPLVVGCNPDLTVNERDPVTVAICVDGTPPYAVQWYRDGQPIYGVREGSDFNSSDGGFVGESGGAFVDAVWQYDAGSGTWYVNGDRDDCGSPAFATLTSPAYTMTTGGEAILTFKHRYSFEYDGTTRWDGGNVRVSVNAGAFTPVPAGSFSQNGYATDKPIGGNNILAGQYGFNGESVGYGAGEFVESVATLGSFNVGDVIQVQFAGGWDECSRAALPNWQINEVEVVAGKADGLAYRIPSALPSRDNGSEFYAVVSNPGGQETSRTALLTVLADTTPPAVVSVVGENTFTDVLVEYSEAVEPLSAVEPFSYNFEDVSDGSTFGAVAVQMVAPNKVRVQTKVGDNGVTLKLGGEYRLTIEGVVDLAEANPNVLNTTVTFRAPSPTPGYVLREFYRNIGGVAVLDMTSNAKYPFSPDDTCYFDSMSIGARDTGDNYGARVSAYFIPEQSGDHIFYLRSDDASQLWLSPTYDPAGKVLIAEETGCCGNFSKIASQPQPLVAGQVYYIEMLMKEGGGGDYADAAFKLSTDPTPPDALSIIPGRYLAVAASTPPGASINITQNPQNTQGTENATVTLTAAATVINGPCGAAVTYQWRKNGVAIPLATGASYTTPPLKMADDGASFDVLARIPGLEVESAAAVVTVIPDTQAPSLVSASGLATEITATFSEAMDPVTALDPSKYSLADGSGFSVQVLSASFVDPVAANVVFLITARQNGGSTYTLTVNGVKDGSAAGNPVPANSQASYSTPFEYLGSAYIEYWTDIGGTAVNDLLNNASYPNSPNAAYTCLLGAWAMQRDRLDNYGARIRAFFTAPETGNYRFYIRSDDASRLWLNPNGASPDGKIVIAEETGCCGNFSKIQSAVFALQAGRVYYMEGVVKEGGGGDNFDAAFKLETDPTGPDSLSPIPGRYLSTIWAQNTGGATVVITQDPADVSSVENDYAMFTAAASVNGTLFCGAPGVKYQWRLNGVPIPGANAPTYERRLLLSDNGALIDFMAVIPGAQAVSLPASLTVTPDNKPPYPVLAQGNPTFDTVRVRFNEGLSAIGDAFSYELHGPGGVAIQISQVIAGAEDRDVILMLGSRLQPDTLYTLTVGGVIDLNNNEVAPNTTIDFRSFVLSPGFARREFYFNTGSGISVSDLTGAAVYPNSPSLVDYNTVVEGVVNLYDNYGIRISGYLQPKVSGTYDFFISADDRAEFWLSTDATPANKQVLCREPEWNNSRQWLVADRRNAAAPENRSATLFPDGIPLVAGQLYYYETLMKEGGGGDNIAVAVIPHGGTPPVNGSTPISGAFNLVVAADPVGASVEITQQPQDTALGVGCPDSVPAFIADFESGLPAGTAVHGNASVGGGILHLTDAVNSQSSAFVIEDFTGGAGVGAFTASFKVRMADSTCCGDAANPRPADGFSFNFANDLPNGVGGPNGPCCGAEDGQGTGLTISFDAWDNGAGNDTDAPAIEVIYAGQVKAVVSLAGVREGGRAPLTAIPTDPATSQPMTLYTSGADFADVQVTLDLDGTVDVMFKGVMVLENVATGYVPTPGRFGFAGRTGGANQTHWIDDLNIIVSKAAAFSVAGTGAITGNNNHPVFIQWQKNGVDILGANNPTLFAAVGPADAGAQFRALLHVPGAMTASAAATFTMTDAPQVAIVSPPDGSTVASCPAVTIVAEASDPDGSVAMVTFFAEGVGAIGADMNGADGWSVTIPNPPAGVYIVTAVATDNAGATCASEPIMVTVTDETPVAANLSVSTLEDTAVTVALMATDDDVGLTYKFAKAGFDVTTPGDAIVPTSVNSPGAEGVANAIDNNSGTKYLNFDKLNTGFTVTPSAGATIVTGLTLTSANDAPERDPASYLLEGSNDGMGFTLISSAAVPAFSARFQKQSVFFPNTTAYTVYRLTFPTVANAGAANSMQIAEVELLSTPEPVNGMVAVVGNMATYTPAANYYGPDMFFYTATDPCGNESAPAAVSITVVPVNDAPTCTAASATVCEDEPVAIELPAADVDDEMLAYMVATPPAHGTVTLAGNIATYRGNLDYNGVDSFTFMVADPGGLQAGPCMVSITVVAGNDSPVGVIDVRPTVDLGPTVPGINVMSPNNIGACVTLDATQSSDVDNDFSNLSFTWMVNGMPIGTGPVLADVCLLVGENEVKLIVSDNTGATGACDEPAESETVQVVTVLTGMEASEELINQIYDSMIERKNKQQFIATCKTAAAAFERGSFGAGINMLEALINKFEAQLTDNPLIQAQWIHEVQSITDGLSAPVTCEGCAE